MNTKFLTSKNWGGQIKFVVLASLFSIVLNVQLDGQLTPRSTMAPYYIEGESLWRMQSYGVSNHYFDIGTFLILDHTIYPTTPIPVTGECGYEYYPQTTVNCTMMKMKL